MKLSIIAALDTNGLIGNSNALPWYLPADLKHFKEITTGHTILMGRKTFMSIGKPLPNRINIVLSKQEIDIPGCIVARSIEEAVTNIDNQEEVFIIGGAQLYQQMIDKVDKLYITRINHAFVGDIYFPKIDINIWHETQREDHSADEKNRYDYSFLIFTRQS